MVVVHPPDLGLIKADFGIMSQQNLWLIKQGFGRTGQPVSTSGDNQPNLWLIKEGFGSEGQPVNPSGGNQLKTYL